MSKNQSKKKSRRSRRPPGGSTGCGGGCPVRRTSSARACSACSAPRPWTRTPGSTSRTRCCWRTWARARPPRSPSGCGPRWPRTGSRTPPARGPCSVGCWWTRSAPPPTGRSKRCRTTAAPAKLAGVLAADGRHVVLGAADTFRAAAAAQLQTWAERVGAVVVRAASGTDPASVAFDAVKRGIADGADAVLIDTAGRLHTKTGLMDELGKVKRVIEKQAKVDEVLLVLDATTGQNGLVQATVFADVVNITGIVLTKLDGTAKGGIVVAVQRALNVPVKLVGLGEGPDDLAPFEPEAFVDALLGDAKG